MNKLLLSALTAAMLAGTASANKLTTPGMMKSLREHVPFTTLVTSEKKMIPALEGSAEIKGEKKRVLKLDNSSLVNPFNHKATTRAEEEENELYMDFSYAQYNVGGLYSYASFFGETVSMRNLEKVYLFIYFNDYYAEMYDNCRIKDFSFVTGGNYKTLVNELTEATVFITDKMEMDKDGNIDLSAIPDNIIYEETYEVTSEPVQLETLPIKEDYIIKKGHPFVIGYEVSPTSLDDAFVVTDGQVVNYAIGSLIGFKEKRKDIAYGALGDLVGNLCIYLTIVGDDLPKDGLTLYDFEMPLQVNPGQDFDATVHLENANANDVASFEYTYKIGNQETKTVTYELPEPLPYGSVIPFNLSGLVTEEIGLNIPFAFEVTKVNGQENYYTTGLEARFKSFDMAKGYEPHALIEEGTSIQCGWCPMGISMMEYAAATYPEYYHRAALHYNMGTATDPMYNISNDNMSSFFQYLPTAYVSRWLYFDPQEYATGLTEIKEMFGMENAAAGIVGLNVLPASNNKTTVTADVQFALDVENADRYRLGFYVTEDGVGPYTQLNYYSGMEGDYDDWNKEPENVKVDDYNDVVRYVKDAAEGCKESLPTSIKAGETYSYSVDVDLSNVRGKKYNVIAFILDKDGQEILNSAVLATDKDSAVEGIEADSATMVYGVNGGIVIKGDYNNAEVISIDGKKVAAVSGKEYVKLASGIYIVNVDGNASKVIVK